MAEAAFVMPIFFAMVFAAAEYGLMYAAQSTVAQSVRSGARYGSANYAIAGNQAVAADATRDKVVNDLRARNRNDLPVELLIYKATSSGTPESGDFANCGTRCLRYVWNGFTYAYVSGTWTDPDACGANLDSVGVYATPQHKYVTGVFGDQTTIAFHSVMRLEPLPVQQCPIGAS